MSAIDSIASKVLIHKHQMKIRRNHISGVGPWDTYGVLAMIQRVKTSHNSVTGESHCMLNLSVNRGLVVFRTFPNFSNMELTVGKVQKSSSFFLRKEDSTRKIPK